MQKKHYTINVTKNLDEYLVRMQYKGGYGIGAGAVSEVANTETWTYETFIHNLKKPTKAYKTINDAATALAEQVHKFFMRGDEKPGDIDHRFREIQVRSGSKKQPKQI